MEHLLTGDAIIALISLTVMEIILGIDNIIFISIITGKLPTKSQAKARNTGLLLALTFRILLLLIINWIVGLTAPIMSLTLWGDLPLFELSIKDLILVLGGAFLIAKSVHEIHEKLEGAHVIPDCKPPLQTFASTLGQIVLIDIVFSFDSILTAVGLSDQIIVMILAVIFAMIVMLIFSQKISDFINNRPTVKMLALAFLILIGLMLMIEGMHQHVNKGYIYFAMTFALVVELFNDKLRRKRGTPIQLKKSRMIAKINFNEKSK